MKSMAQENKRYRILVAVILAAVVVAVSLIFVGLAAQGDGVEDSSVDSSGGEASDPRQPAVTVSGVVEVSGNVSVAIGEGLQEYKEGEWSAFEEEWSEPEISLPDMSLPADEPTETMGSLVGGFLGIDGGRYTDYMLNTLILLIASGVVFGVVLG